MPIHQLRDAFNSAHGKLKWRFNKSRLQRSFNHSRTSQEELAARPNYSRTPYSTSDRAGEYASNTVSQDPPLKKDTNRTSSTLDIFESRPGLRASVYYEVNVNDFMLYAEQGVSLVEIIRDVVPDDSSIQIGEDEARETEHGRCCRENVTAMVLAPESYEHSRRFSRSRVSHPREWIFSLHTSQPTNKWIKTKRTFTTARATVDLSGSISKVSMKISV